MKVEKQRVGRLLTTHSDYLRRKPQCFTVPDLIRLDSDDNNNARLAERLALLLS